MQQRGGRLRTAEGDAEIALLDLALPDGFGQELLGGGIASQQDQAARPGVQTVAQHSLRRPAPARQRRTHALEKGIVRRTVHLHTGRFVHDEDVVVLIHQHRSGKRTLLQHVIV